MVQVIEAFYELSHTPFTRDIPTAVSYTHLDVYKRQYLNSMGYDAYIASPDANARVYTFIPYIFSVDEMERIFACSDSLCPHRFSTIPLIMPVILRMLYSCGLRISEAVNLQNKHVNLQEGILEIKNSKFGKDRLLPMSSSMATICRQYYHVMHNLSLIHI